MAHGTPKGKIDDQFKKRVEELEEKAKNQSENFKSQNGLRPWHTPEAMKSVSLLDVPNLHEPAWNRDKLNQLYSDEILAVEKSKGGVVGDLIGVKRQIDFMAVEERAWRLRHASFTRCAVLAHGRLDGHGTASVGIFATVKNEIENRMAQGAITGGG
jgi:hypothetical protein